VTGPRLFRLALVLLLLLVVQATLGLDLRFFGAHPEILWLLPITTGLVAGPEAGALVGFVAGLTTDLLLPTPFGLSALIGCLLGFAVGQLTQSTDHTLWWLAPVAALLGSAAAVMLYAVLGAVLGQQQFLHLDLGAIVAVVSVTNALLALPVQRLVRWAVYGPRPRRPATAGSRW
jgi:rod shape-determining protein MreD